MERFRCIAIYLPKGPQPLIPRSGLGVSSALYDLNEGFIRMMDETDYLVGPINLGNPGEFTMLELAEKVIAQTGSKSKISFEPLPQDDPKQRQPDITKAKREFNWEPKVSLDKGLEKTIAYFKKALA